MIQENLKQFLKFIINLLKLYVNIQKSVILFSANLERKLFFKFFNLYTKTN